MRCPSCGLAMDQTDLDRCPQCGRALTSPALATQPPQAQPSYLPYPPNPAPAPAPPTPVMAQDLHGPATPSGLPPAASSNAPAAYPPGLRPPPPVRKQRSRVGLVVGIIVAAVVLLAACGGGAIWATRSMGQANPTNFVGTPSASASASPIDSVIYYESFSTSADGWAQDPGHCYLDDDGYHAKNNYICYAPASAQTDATISVTGQQLSGATTDGYGLAFRLANDNSGSGYRFGIDSESEWVFAKCVNRQCTNLVDFTSNSAIKGGLQTANTLKVAATGSHFEFFVNDTKVGSADDATFAAGFVGLFGGGAIDCAFTEFAVLIPLPN